MGRVALLVILLAGAVILYRAMDQSPTEIETAPLSDWDMRQAIQEASDNERNPWNGDE